MVPSLLHKPLNLTFQQIFHYSNLQLPLVWYYYSRVARHNWWIFSRHGSRILALLQVIFHVGSVPALTYATPGTCANRNLKLRQKLPFTQVIVAQLLEAHWLSSAAILLSNLARKKISPIVRQRKYRNDCQQASNNCSTITKAKESFWRCFKKQPR